MEQCRIITGSREDHGTQRTDSALVLIVMWYLGAVMVSRLSTSVALESSWKSYFVRFATTIHWGEDTCWMWAAASCGPEARRHQGCTKENTDIHYPLLLDCINMVSICLLLVPPGFLYWSGLYFLEEQTKINPYVLDFFLFVCWDKQQEYLIQ